MKESTNLVNLPVDYWEREHKKIGRFPPTFSICDTDFRERESFLRQNLDLKWEREITLIHSSLSD